MPAGLRIGAGDAAFGAYGMPYWNARQGGYAMGGLGDSTICSQVDDQGNCIASQTFPDPSPGVTAGPGNWVSAVQLGVQDAFNFAKLFNPVPPGTVMQTGPGGYSYVARAAPGQILPSVGLPGFGSGSGLWILLIGGAALLFVFGRGK